MKTRYGGCSISCISYSNSNLSILSGLIIRLIPKGLDRRRRPLPVYFQGGRQRPSQSSLESRPYKDRKHKRPGFKASLSRSRVRVFGLGKQPFNMEQTNNFQYSTKQKKLFLDLVFFVTSMSPLNPEVLLYRRYKAAIELR